MPEAVQQPLAKRVRSRWSSMTSDRSTWDAHWRDIGDYFLPRAYRFNSQKKRRQGTRRNTKIINSTGTVALRVLASGMMAGITSPARPWFRLVTPDPALMQVHDVRTWLGAIEGVIRLIFQRSNLYSSLPKVYRDLASWGVSTLWVDEDIDDVIRTYVHPIGSYALQNGANTLVDTCYREVMMTVGQIEEKFGLDHASKVVQDHWKNGRYDEEIDLIHAVEPNRHANRATPEMPVRSIWVEKAGKDTDEPVAVRGYNEFPVMAPRWERTGIDVYGSSPAMDCLGDVRGLQHLERNRAQIIDKLARPPMVAPVELAEKGHSFLPGTTTFVDQLRSNQGVKAAYTPDPATLALDKELERYERRIGRCLFVDLFLMLANSGSPQKTAREVEERHEEKMLQLGPVLEGVQDELLDPLVDRTFAVAHRRGLLPPAPQELQGQELRVEYISILAQAQKMVGTVGIERLGAFVESLTAIDPNAADRLNTDRTIQEYADMLGTPPGILRDDADLEERRQARAAMETAAQMAQVAKEGAQAAQAASGASLAEDNLLSAGAAAMSGAAA